MEPSRRCHTPRRGARIAAAPLRHQDVALRGADGIASASSVIPRRASRGSHQFASFGADAAEIERLSSQAAGAAQPRKTWVGGRPKHASRPSARRGSPSCTSSARPRGHVLGRLSAASTGVSRRLEPPRRASRGALPRRRCLGARRGERCVDRRRRPRGHRTRPPLDATSQVSVPCGHHEAQRPDARRQDPRRLESASQDHERHVRSAALHRGHGARF